MMPINLLAWYLTHGMALIVEAIVVVMVGGHGAGFHYCGCC